MKPTVQQVILEILTRGDWYVPHEVSLEIRLRGFPCSSEATTARMRDLRKEPFGGHCLKKRIRKGTGYYEYMVISKVEQAKAA